MNRLIKRTAVLSFIDENGLKNRARKIFFIPPVMSDEEFNFITKKWSEEILNDKCSKINLIEEF